ncbi:MAG: EamA family transporter [Coriobacteriia bacterium]|nr:EamA family transporter [Coriobacteriia bacterium]
MTPDAAAAPRQRLVALARIAAAGLIWGTIPLIMRSADGASVVKVFFRVFFAWVVIALGLVATGGWRELRGLSRSKVLQVVGQGLILTLNWFLFLTAIDMTTVATAELLGYTGPVIVAALAPYVTGEPFDRRVIAPLSLAMVGIVVILAPHGLQVGTDEEAIGALLAFASAFTYATLLLRSKKILRGISSGALMFMEYATASLVLLPFVIAAYLRGDAPSTPVAYAALVSLGIIHTAFAGFLFLGGLRRVRTDHAAILTYVEPVSAVVFASLFLSEALTWTTLVGGALVIGGGVVVARLEAREGIETVPLEAAGTDVCLDDADSRSPEPP